MATRAVMNTASLQKMIMCKSKKERFLLIVNQRKERWPEAKFITTEIDSQIVTNSEALIAR